MVTDYRHTGLDAEGGLCFGVVPLGVFRSVLWLLVAKVQAPA
ncbi:MAG: hypothetical protein AAFP10_02390 [Pseudomonadota bacterium]